MMKFKCRLKIILWEKGISQKVFAEQVEMSPTSLSALVNGKSLPTFENAYKISKALDMPLYEIWVEKE